MNPYPLHVQCSIISLSVSLPLKKVRPLIEIRNLAMNFHVLSSWLGLFRSGCTARCSRGPNFVFSVCVNSCTDWNGNLHVSIIVCMSGRCSSRLSNSLPTRWAGPSVALA